MFVFLVVFCLYGQFGRGIQGSLGHIKSKYFYIAWAVGNVKASTRVFYPSSQIQSHMFSFVGFIILFSHLNL